MQKKEKFTIVLAHYNQMNYIKESIYSILSQEYNNIELIIADDCSKKFDKKEITNFINKYQHNNLCEIKYIENSKNLGTVKTLNKAIDISTGEYILFFAADDKLYDKSVIGNFAKAFEQNKRYNVITAQSIMCDNLLLKKNELYVNSKKAIDNNNNSSWHLFEEMSKNCIYSSGATAYKTELFKKYGKFDEKYKLIEDWTYWLKILKQNEMIYYFDFKALLHRDGGVSHNNDKKIPPHVIQFYKDLLNAYKFEVMPFIEKFSIENVYLTTQKYLNSILIYSNKNESIAIEYQEEKISIFDKYNISEINYNKFVEEQKLEKKSSKKTIKRLLKNNKILKLSMLTYIIMLGLLLPELKRLNYGVSILYIIALFIILYILMHKVDNIDFLLTDSLTCSIILTCIVGIFLKEIVFTIFTFVIFNIVIYGLISIYYNKRKR